MYVQISVCVRKQSNLNRSVLSSVAAHVTGLDQSSFWKALHDFLPPTLSVALFFGLHISLLTDNSEACCQWPHVLSIISVWVKTSFECSMERKGGSRIFSRDFLSHTRSLAVRKGQTWQGSCCVSEDSGKVSPPLFVLSSVCSYHTMV